MCDSKAWFIAGALALFTGVTAITQTPSRSIRDGVYSDAQAVQGKALFQRSCAGCHGENLEGTMPGTALASVEFVKKWEGSTIADLLTRVSATMPQDQPGALSRPEYLAVIAFILQSNEAKSGPSPLPTDDAELKTIRITSVKP